MNGNLKHEKFDDVKGAVGEGHHRIHSLGYPSFHRQFVCRVPRLYRTGTVLSALEQSLLHSRTVLLANARENVGQHAERGTDCY